MMANPQAEEGHVDIANEIMEALCRTRIPGEAMQILFVILRKTYGWHKKEDAISLSQFQNATGLKRSHVCRSLKRLLDLNIIYRGSPQNDTSSTKYGTSPIQLYGFQKDFDLWGVVPKKVPSPKSGTGGSPQFGNRVVPNLGHTKETIQKKTKQKKENILRDPQIKLFIDFYFQTFKEHFGKAPIIQGAKDASIVKSLLRSISIEELQALLVKLFNSSDQFIIQSGYTLGVFKSQINKLRIGATENKLHSGLRQWAEEIIEEEKNETR